MTKILWCKNVILLTNYKDQVLGEWRDKQWSLCTADVMKIAEDGDVAPSISDGSPYQETWEIYEKK